MMNVPETFQERLHIVQTRIDKACFQAHRSRASVQLLAVSKGHPATAVREAARHGIRQFGESYLQELSAKANELTDLAIEWHFIGHIQSRKIPSIVAHSSCVHALASFKHARLMADAAIQYGKSPFPVYIAVNLGNEPQKSGLPVKEAMALAKEISSSMPELQITGYMSVPPSNLDLTDPNTERLYRSLAEAAAASGLPGVSLGMSLDLELAIRCGSTCVRIGTDLFGSRSY